MDKERMHELLKHRNDKEIHTSNLFEDIETLLEENKKQKEVIDKVEELLIIKKTRCLNEDDYVLNVPDLDEILDILKEVSEWIFIMM